MQLRAIAAVGFAAFAAAAHADPVDAIDCSKPQHAQQLINVCSSRHAQEADAKRAALYQEIVDAISDAAERGRFIAAENAWLGYREAQCRLEAPPSRRGSMSSMMFTSCMREMTEARITVLTRYRDCNVRRDWDKCKS